MSLETYWIVAPSALVVIGAITAVVGVWFIDRADWRQQRPAE
jgi:hypothetical protein